MEDRWRGNKVALLRRRPRQLADKTRTVCLRHHPLTYWRLEVNPLDCKGNYNATSNNMKLVHCHWPLMGGLLHWHSEEKTGQGRSPPRPLLAVPNVTAHPSTACLPITVSLYTCTLLRGFSVPIKGLIKQNFTSFKTRGEWLHYSSDDDWHPALDQKSTL